MRTSSSCSGSDHVRGPFRARASMTDVASARPRLACLFAGEVGAGEIVVYSCNFSGHNATAVKHPVCAMSSPRCSVVLMTEEHRFEDERIPLQVRVQRRLIERVDVGARAAGITRPEAVRRALLDWTEARDVAEERRRRLAGGREREVFDPLFRGVVRWCVCVLLNDRGTPLRRRAHPAPGPRVMCRLVGRVDAGAREAVGGRVVPARCGSAARQEQCAEGGAPRSDGRPAAQLRELFARPASCLFGLSAAIAGHGCHLREQIVPPFSG